MVTNHGAGDTVTCKITYNGKLALRAARDYERTHNFYIICLYDEGYLLLVPSDLYLKNSFILTAKECRKLGLPEKFVDTDVLVALDKHVVSVQTKMTGVHCVKCNAFAEFGDTNRVGNDGKYVFVCWNCIHYPQYR